MGGSSAEAAQVTIQGRVAEQHTATQPLPVTLYVDGNLTGKQSVPRGATEFRLSYPFPESAKRKSSVRVAIEVDRTVSTTEDPRAYGLAMGTVAIVP
jgi:hypothetical protein